jgi:hypothetical protein
VILIGFSDEVTAAIRRDRVAQLKKKKNPHAGFFFFLIGEPNRYTIFWWLAPGHPSLRG